MQIISGILVLALILAIVYFLGTGSSQAPHSRESASASSRGANDTSADASSGAVSDDEIKVAFPVANLEGLASNLGFAGDIEFSEQAKAIKLFVGQLNAGGGINGRKIDPIIANFDPTNEVDMRALCKQWTEGSGAVFAVLDGVGAYSGDNELCVTQEGHTPMLSQWTTVSNWTQEGAPNLWWTGPNDAQILQATVDWGLSAGLLGSGVKVAVVAGDRTSDQLALNSYLLPDLARAGIKPMVRTIAANPSETAATQSEAPLVVQQLESAGITSVIPLLPFNVYFPVLEAETGQSYFPRLLLSDYENSIETALGLIPQPFEKALDGQEGVTTETLGGIDDTRPESEGGYDPGVRSCFALWHKAYPQIPSGNQNFYIEEQGPVQGWCQEIRLFAAAAKAAGRHLDPRSFDSAMATISNFPGGYSPNLSYGPNRFSGPAEYRVVKLHTNSPQTNQCKMPFDQIPEGVCWVAVDNWQPLPGN